MTFPPESIQLGTRFANTNVFATFQQPANPLLAWNGSAWVANTLANAVLGAVQLTTDASGNASLPIPAGITVQFMYAIWPQAGSNPATSDMQTPPAGVAIPLWTGGNGESVPSASAGNTYDSSDSIFVETDS